MEFLVLKEAGELGLFVMGDQPAPRVIFFIPNFFISGAPSMPHCFDSNA